MQFYKNFIDVELCVPSSKISSDMREYIITLLKNEYEKKAFEKFGIINQIIKIMELTKIDVSNIEGNLNLNFKLLVESYVPKIYDEIKIPIKKILSCGIFLEEPNIKILVSDYDKTKILKEGDNILIVLTDIRFEKDSFHCLANIHEENLLLR